MNRQARRFAAKQARQKTAPGLNTAQAKAIKVLSEKRHVLEEIQAKLTELEMTLGAPGVDRSGTPEQQETLVRSIREIQTVVDSGVLTELAAFTEEVRRTG